ncbi:MAG: hypothetical protein COZ68_11465 [Deltaproteobacteria bacterium CG_4_8_14_3_um_filter_43_13]|nr:MAG: hypothetical protein COZ68_11465 [Deltaproteobacteria bacterium CG_4_8_14_3_um_filter_43_13]
MLADDMRRLAEEISNAYEERVKGVAEMRAAEADRKSTTQADLKKTADQLRADLDRFKSDLDASEADRKDTTQADLKKTADQLRADLDRFMSNLDAAEAERKDTTQAELNEKTEELRGSLASFRAELSASVAGLMGEFKKDSSEAAEVWNEILSTMRSAGREAALTCPAKVEAGVEVKTVSEAIEEEEAAEEIIEREPLRSKILGILEDNTDGLRMVEIADTLGIENWRSLIPLMRELKDNGEVRKEDSSYYAA